MGNRTVRRGGRAAFTLIELLLVLVILAILVSVVALKFTGQSEEARKTKAQTDLAMFETALDAFEIHNGRFPASDEGLNALVSRPGWATKWKGPYIKRVEKDPWGNPYVYRHPGNNNPEGFDLSSLGPDGQESVDDINNWSTTEG